MKLPSYLKLSRHGIFYYRIQFLDEQGTRKEMNASLGTRDPTIAKAIAYTLTSKIKPFLTSRTHRAMSIDPLDLDPNSIRELTLKGLKIGATRIDEVVISDEPQQRKKDLDTLTEFAKTFASIETEQEKNTKQYFENEKLEIANYLENETLTLKNAIDDFMLYDKSNLALSSQRTYRFRLKMLSDVVGENKLVNDINTPDIVKAKNNLVLTAPHNSKRHTKEVGKLNPKTIDDTLILWRNFFNYLISEGKYKHDNPAKTVKKPSQNKTAAVGGAAPFTNDELEKIFNYKLLSEVKTPHSLFALTLAYYTGARANEIAQLSLEHIKVIDDCIVIEITNDEIEKTRTKNSSSQRTIPLHPIFNEIGLLDYIDDIKSLSAKRLFPYLPLDSNGKRERYISQDINAYLKKVGVWKHRTKTLHSFRDTFISTMRRLTKEFAVNDYVGHSRKGVEDTTYLDKLTLNEFKELVVNQIPFKLDIEKLKYKKGRWNDYIKKKMCD